MGQRTLEFRHEHNRGEPDAPERLCVGCDKWKPLEDFKLTHGHRGYKCYRCENELQHTRDARKRGELPPPERDAAGLFRAKVFDETKVDVRTWLRFASQPTPQQLIERNAA